MKTLTVVIGLHFLMVCDVNSEPSRSVKWLMNEPVTLWDMGLYTLENYINDDPIIPEDALISVRYDWDKNQIKIELFSAPDSTVAKAFPSKQKYIDLFLKPMCKRMLDNMKLVLKINSKTGKSFMPELGSVVSYKFSHNGWRSKSRPEYIAETLDSMTELSVIFPGYITGKCPLLSKMDEVYFRSYK